MLTVSTGSLDFIPLHLTLVPCRDGEKSRSGGSPPGDASSWVVRRLQVLVSSRSYSRRSNVRSLFLLFHTETLPKRPWLTLTGENRMPALWNCAGWMDIRSRAHWNNTLNWREDQCSVQFVLSGVHLFFFAIFVIVAFSGGDAEHLFLRLWSPAMCLVWKIPGGRCKAGSSLGGQDICNW